MDYWLKALVACACVVVIPGGGYYLGTTHKASPSDSDRYHSGAQLKI